MVVVEVLGVTFALCNTFIIVVYQAVKSVSRIQYSWIVSTMESSAFWGRILHMSVMRPDIPGASSLFIFFVRFNLYPI